MEKNLAGNLSRYRYGPFPVYIPLATSFPVSPPKLFPFSPKKSLLMHAKKRNPQLQSVLKPTTNQEKDEEAEEEEESLIEEELDDGTFMEDSDFLEDEFELEDRDLYAGDGSGGGGIQLAGTWWDRKALALAEEVSMSFGGDLKIYAFKTSINSTIRVRIEKLSKKSGSPSMTDIEDFASAYRARLNEAELAGAIPEDISLEVSSPGVERIIRIPQELDRFKDFPMYVKYVSEGAATGSLQENEGVFKLVSFDMESSHCTWSVADVKRNREQAGKGRPLSKKQRQWRLQTPFHSLRLVRLYSEC